MIIYLNYGAVKNLTDKPSINLKKYMLILIYT